MTDICILPAVHTCYFSMLLGDGLHQAMVNFRVCTYSVLYLTVHIAVDG